MVVDIRAKVELNVGDWEGGNYCNYKFYAMDTLQKMTVNVQ